MSNPATQNYSRLILSIFSIKHRFSAHFINSQLHALDLYDVESYFSAVPRFLLEKCHSSTADQAAGQVCAVSYNFLL